MHGHGEPLSLSSPPRVVFLILILSQLASCWSSSLNSFIYVGCSQLKYNPGSPYESNVNSVLTSILNSASYANYNNFKISLPGSAADDVVYGLFQCRGDLSGSDCHECVTNALGRLGSTCVGASGGALQLEGCFVRYDNTSFVGAPDKTVVSDKCGPLIADDSDVLTRRDAVLSYLEAGGQFFRVSGSGKVQGVAQCVQDLSATECQDCLSDAIQRLKTQCGSSTWGDMFLAKCYARYSERGYTSKSENDDEVEKTLAIFIGLVAGVAILVVFLSFLSKALDHKGGGK
ncbi:plasmodesmata-located protein 6 [Perilla frutescens var. hirtella]|uniref:Plasmodesmata-located protein 6 n=1 Tax=Perilla frutescens var. hirtella TaxID=608512 RepID=A0AAD4JBU8_PERFH|nr:plasmodesmata-located protein 6 [Perilla frutescens var. frutescens]KAH6792696.1 plasmodesmata-located protein 6 [Perilla frutescens var. hirtella]KAH6830924.1 plasmodesmata-located protein 6 [Perilla frutescens var. hirtella]